MDEIDGLGKNKLLQKEQLKKCIQELLCTKEKYDETKKSYPQSKNSS